MPRAEFYVRFQPSSLLRDKKLCWQICLATYLFCRWDPSGIWVPVHLRRRSGLHTQRSPTRREVGMPQFWKGGLSEKRKAGRHELGERPLPGQEGAVHRHRSSQQAGVISPSRAMDHLGRWIKIKEGEHYWREAVRRHRQRYLRGKTA